jgi:polyvinyl alcohol dehydrogenase (cytochrome)
VVALDAATGQQIWKTYTIPERPRPVRKNSAGTQLYGPSGAAIWAAPTLDYRRRVLYVGTSNGYIDVPDSGSSDAVIAFDLDTGKRLWWHQLTSMDAFLVGCPGRIDVQGQPRDPERAEPQRIAYLNCPDPDQLTENIDVDVQAVMLHTLSDDRTILVVGQQTGRVYALDPDREGAVLWQLYAGEDSEDRANITFGGATDGRLAYFPLLYKPSEHRGITSAPRPTGGLAAIRVGTGELAWYQPTPTAHCPDDAPRGCSSGQNGAATAMPGIVFSGTMDGMLRANSTTDGRIIWEYDTVQEFETVNAVAAKGGTLNGPGPTVVDGMLFTGSGYAIASGITGNVLLAFGVD